MLRYLNDFNGEFLLVSHDRFFLNQVVGKIWELGEGDLKEYQGDYLHYEEMKEKEMQKSWQDFQSCQREKKRIQGAIQRQR